MNEQQRLACSKVIEGHNLLLLGQSATGKSFVVQSIYRGLTEKYNGAVVKLSGKTVLS